MAEKSKVVELFGLDADRATRTQLSNAVLEQICPFRGTQCVKTRKSDSKIAIGTCVVRHGNEPVVICPHRLLQNRQVFVDCLHLARLHEPGNELHVVPEIQIPGGNVDYFLVSARGGIVKDFVGIELQTMDTVGSIWMHRQDLLSAKGISVDEYDPDGSKSFGMNWKMTAKTILMQLHHKIESFHGWNKSLVVVVQDVLMTYIAKTFVTTHFHAQPLASDPMHFHAYRLEGDGLRLSTRFSTDVAGVAAALSRGAGVATSNSDIMATLQSRLGPNTMFKPF